MKSRPFVLHAVALIVVSLVLPTAAAQTSEGDAQIKCNPTPLGTGGGLVGAVKAFGNAVIYGSCVLVASTVNAVCIFLTGSPCVLAATA